MSLVECSDCKKMKSDQALACIHCGRPIDIAKIDKALEASPSALGHQSAQLASGSSGKKFKITPLKTFTTLVMVVGYIAVLGTLAYLSTKSAEYWYLGLICVGVIGFVIWKLISTAYEVEIIGTDIKVTRIIGTLIIGIAEIKSMKTGAGWLQLVSSDRTIGITDLENLDDFMQIVRATNQQL